MSPRALWALLVVGCAAPADAGEHNFLPAGEVSKDDVETRLLSEIIAQRSLSAEKGRSGGHGQDEDGARFARLEKELRATFVALPKDAGGFLGHNTVRYALHRLMVQRHGWFIKGLEPDGDVRSASSPTRLKEWVPDYLQEFLEKRGVGRGFDLGDLVAIAATLQGLIQGEAVKRLEEAFRVFGISKDGSLTEDEADEVLSLYLMVYLQGGATMANTQFEASKKLRVFERKYTGWNEVKGWVGTIRANISRSVAAAAAARGDPEPAMDFNLASTIAEAIGTRYGEFNDLECRDLKKALLGIEDRRPGRVRLSAFYARALYSHWQFTEKVDYLRSLGALDESDPAAPSVIVPNYIASRPQCLEASAFYAVCCRNECEDIMLQLERELAEAFAAPENVVELVAKIPSNTVEAPRTLSTSLKSRLQQVAATNGGRVPLHGRLFAQWMHHAFPRECPYPHEAGNASPQTPDEWMQGTGQDSSTASQEEMVCHVSGPCAGGAESSPSLKRGHIELPWSDAEELLVDAASVTYGAISFTTSPLDSTNRVLRALGLFSVVLGLALASKYGFPGATLDLGDKVQHRAGWWVTVGLFVLPLVILSLDFWLNFSAANELLVCCLCWSLAVLIFAKLRVQRGLAVVHDDHDVQRVLV